MIFPGTYTLLALITSALNGVIFRDMALKGPVLCLPMRVGP